MNQTTKYYYQHLTTNQKVGIRDTQATDETLSKENEERMKRTHVIIQEDNNEHFDDGKGYEVDFGICNC